MHMPRLSYANVMSTVAVFLALGGTSYAVTKLPKGSVGARELGKGAVTTEKLAKAAVTGETVRDGSIAGADLAAGALVPGPRGPRGSQGPAGKDGANGTNGTSAGETLLGPVAEIGTFVMLPLADGAFGQLSTLVVPPGAWIIDAQTRLQHGPNPANGVWADCDIVSAAGDLLGRSSAFVGNTPGASASEIVSPSAAVTFPATTKLTFGCRHQQTLTQHIGAVQTSFRATRVLRVDQQ